MKNYNTCAPNSTMGGASEYMGGDESGKLKHQIMPNNRVNGYITNQFAGGGKHKKDVVKGKPEHRKEEDEYGSDYGV
jgi:hypothetical protein